jgi:hypothetical protein
MTWIEERKKYFVCKNELGRLLQITPPTMTHYIENGVIEVEFTERNEFLIDPNKAIEKLEICNPEKYNKEAIKERLIASGISLDSNVIYSQLGLSKKFPKIKIKNTPKDENPSLDVNKEVEFNNIITPKEAEVIKQIYLAKQAKLKFLVSLGKLVSKDDIGKVWLAIAGEVRKSMLAIPSRVSEICAANKDGKDINNILTNEIHVALKQLQFSLINIVTTLHSNLSESDFE